MKHLRLLGLAFAGLFYCLPAFAQNSGAVPQYAVPIGQGLGHTGFGAAAPGTAGQALLSTGPTSAPVFGSVAGASFGVQNANKVYAGPTTGADAIPSFRLIACQDLPALAGGDVTSSIGSCTLSIGASKVTNTMLAGVDIAHGGTGATTAPTARTNLGLVIGTNVQAWDADLDAFALKTAPTGAVVGTTDTQTLTNKTLTSPVLGAATATSINKVAITAPATSATLTIANGKTLTVQNSLTLIGTDTSTYTYPGGSDTLAGVGATQTLTNKTLTSPVINSPTGIVKGDVGLGNVDNTSDANKPVRGLLFGLTLSTAGSSSTFGIAAGSATNSTASQMMTLGSAYTKTSSAWAVGTATGSLDTGTIANSTWYHVFLIKRTDTGVVDVLISTSATAPTLPTNYTVFRRIGSMLTNGSAQWVKFIQDGDLFRWDVPASDYSGVANPGTSAILRALSVPPGVSVEAMFHSRCAMSSTAAVATIFTDPAQSDTTPDFVNAQQIGNVTISPFANLRIRTDTSRQIRVRLSASAADVQFNLVTDGWIDTRGRAN